MFHILHYTSPQHTPSHQSHPKTMDEYRHELEKLLPLVRVSPSILQAYSDQTAETRLVALDLDGTITSAEFMQQIAPHLPQPERGKLYTLTEVAVEGKDEDWEENFTKRVKLLKGVSESTALFIAEAIPLAPCAREFIHALHKKGIETAIITGAYQGIAHSVARRLGIKHVYCSQLEIDNQRFTGNLIPPILSPQGKADALRELLHLLHLSPQECTAIGDSFNDLPMLTSAGKALLYHAIQHEPLPLTDLLPFI